MSGFSDLLKAHAKGIFASGAQFGETATYTFRNQTTRTVKVNVFRDSPQPGQGRAAVPEIRCFIPNDPTDGVEAVNKQGDTLTLSERQGGEAKVHRIVEILTQDPGGWMVRLS